MKNRIVLIAAFLIAGFSVYASALTSSKYTNTAYYSNYGDSFTFVENGITFAVFQNGEFDFYINPRKGFQVGIYGDNVNISFNSGYNYDAYVQYDYYGAVIQVENVPIYYDYYGRVSQIGDVRISYNNYGHLARIGSLHLYYNNYGHFTLYRGYINRYNRHYVYHPYHNYFARPLFEYRVVSYKTYRHNYKPQRYDYREWQSRSKKYDKYSKRDGISTRSRIATQAVPKRQLENNSRSVVTRDQGVKRQVTSDNRMNSSDKRAVQNNTRTRVQNNSNANNVRVRENMVKPDKGTAIKRTAQTGERQQKVVKPNNVKIERNKSVTATSRTSTANRSSNNSKKVDAKRQTVSRRN